MHSIRPIWYRHICLYIFLSLSLPCSNLHANEVFDEHEKLDAYFSSDQTIDTEKAIDFLLSIKRDLIQKGCTKVKLSKLCLHLKMDILAMGISEAVFDNFYNLLKRKETKKSQTHRFCFSTQSNYFCIRDDNEDVPDGIPIGLCKLLAGSLCMVIPHPIAQGIGGAFILSGVNDLIDASRKIKNLNKNILEANIKTSLFNYCSSHLFIQNAFFQGVRQCL